MRDISWDNDALVTEVSGELEIGGTPVDATDLSVSRSIPSNLPDQVAGVGGYTAATGSASVDPQGAIVTDRSPTPWGAETPQPLAPATAYAVVDGQRVPVFRGFVDKASGAASAAATDISLVDATDQLKRSVSIPPLAKIMPPPTTDGATVPMHIGLVSSYLVDRVLRACGFYATPPMAARCILSVPLTGSTYPERGTIRLSRRDNTWREQPYFSNAWHSPLGHTLYAEYEPLISGTTEGNLTRPMEIIFSAGNTHENACRMECVWGNGAAIAVRITSSKSLTVQFTYPTDTSTRTTVFTATTAEIGSWRHVSVRFEPNGDRTTSITIRTNYGGYKKLGRATLPWWTETQPIQKVTIDLRGNNVGGFQVAFPANPSGMEKFTPTANITSRAKLASLYGSPAIVNEDALTLLTEWAQQECAAFWLDEDGVVQWRNREAFISTPVVAERDSTNDLLDLDWSHDVQGAAAKVTVDFKEVAQQRSSKSRLVVWQGGGQSMEPGDIMEEFVSPPADEAWIKVDGTPNLFQAETSKNAFNRGRGSWLGYVAYDKDGNIHGNTEWVGYKGVLEVLGYNTWKITQTWDGNVPAGVDHIKLSTQDGGTVLRPQWQNFNLPVLRAQCRLIFNDADVTASAGGTPGAPDLIHDAGWWVQTEEEAKALAFWLAQQTARPRPVVDGVEITPDPRLQLGDKIVVTDTHRTGVRVTGVITEIQQDIAAGDHTMTLRLLVTNVVATRPTLFEYDQLWGGAVLEDRDAAWSGQTLAQFDAAPLTRR